MSIKLSDAKRIDEFSIHEVKIGRSHPSYIIVEIAQAHDGSLGIAHSFIDAVATTGADAIKFQTHIAEAESTPGEPFRVNFSYEDASRYEYWKRMEFTQEQWLGIADHCREVGITFLSSPFSVEAFELLEKLDVPAWKVGSGETSNPVILEAMISTAKPILLSTGMSGWKEIDKFAQKILRGRSSLALLQCTSKYPTELCDVGINVIDELRERFGVPVGLSDHSGKLTPALTAIGRGGDLVEVHATFSKSMFGPDAQASLTIDQIKKLVQMRDEIYEMLSSPVDKNRMADQLAHMRLLFNKSIAVRSSLQAGVQLKRGDLTVKKPGTGIPAEHLESCIGKTLSRDVSGGSLLNFEDLEK